MAAVSPRAAELLRGVLADRVEQPESRLAVGPVLDLDQALVGQGHQRVEQVTAELGGRPADGLDRFEVAAAGEDRQPIEQQPPALVEQVVAPGNRAPKRLLAGRQVARARRQDVELVLEAGQDRVRRQELGPRRGELDREGHAVEPRRDRGNRRGVVVGHGKRRLDRQRSLDEQPDGGVLAERDRVDAPRPTRQLEPVRARELARIGWSGQARDRQLLLPGDPQGGTAGDDDLEAVGGAQQVRDDRRGVRDLLEVVQDEQDAAVAQPVAHRLRDRARPGVRDPERRRDPWRHEQRVADRLERHEEGPVGEPVRRRAWRARGTSASSRSRPAR